MAVSRGKAFELKVRSDLKKIPEISIDRIFDSVSGYKNISNISDLIFYKYPFICYGEIKSHLGNTFPIANLTQYEKLIAKKGIKGVRAGVILWFIEHDKVLWIPIETFEKLKNDGAKSVNVKLDYDEYNILEIPSVKRRVFMDSDYSVLFSKWEKELEEHGK